MKLSNHPNPQFERKNWVSLNGEWDFGYEKAKGRSKFSFSEKDLASVKSNANLKIKVPFCIESELSGIGYKDFVKLVWYKKSIDVDLTQGRAMLHIGAADYKTSVFVNDKLAGTHMGGYTSFCFDITDYAKNGKNEVVIVCEDDTKSSYIPTGKQSVRKNSYGCSYTRTTGIWQSVYIEYVPESYVKSFKLYPDEKQGNVTIHFELNGCADLKCTAFYDEKQVGEVELKQANGRAIAQLKVDEIHKWELGEGNLYELKISFGEDEVNSYFGLRSVRLEGLKFMLNDKSVFQRLVLDQGFYRKGIYTAQDDEELVKDIKLSMGVGFNGARLHQKVFDPRFLYFCDRMGYMVWGEYANWGIDTSKPELIAIFQQEWAEAIDRDFNHPAIIGWCPFNETWDYHKKKQYDPLLKTVYDFTKAVDSTRPCIDTSGNFHVVTDIYDVHDYNFDHVKFKENFDKLVTENYLYEHVLLDNPGRQKYNGEPVFISEYGGIKWAADSQYKSWGYGKDVKTIDEFVERYEGLTSAIINNEKIMGLCYTQLYDVEQEQNGLFTYDREMKFPQETYDKIKAINEAKASIE